MDFPILVIWMSPILFLAASGVIFDFYFIFSMKIMSVNRIVPFCLSLLFEKMNIQCRSRGRSADQIQENAASDHYLHNMPIRISNQRTNVPVNAHLISWPFKAQNIQNLENIW